MSDIEEVMRYAQEIVTRKELEKLFQEKNRPTGYIGAEPSGLFHIGWMIWAEEVKRLEKAGVKMTILLADWHAYINDKLGGDWKNLGICSDYITDSLKSLGVKSSYVRASELVDTSDYWRRVIDVAKSTSFPRLRRALTIMGRKEMESESDTSKLIYPLMQVSDIYQLDVDIALAGMDQRRAHMLARDVADKLKWKKPVSIHTPLLTSLEGGGRMDPVQAKMSKSKPEGGIFIHDSAEDIERKIKKAYCPRSDVVGNPIVDICRLVIYPKKGFIEMNEKELDEKSLLELYGNGEMDPLTLKRSVSRELFDLLKPCREYFKKRPKNLELMEQIKVTR